MTQPEDISCFHVQSSEQDASPPAESEAEAVIFVAVGESTPFSRTIVKWVCLEIEYTTNYSHLVGIMIINHWV